jgi:hypothetical protein
MTFKDASSVSSSLALSMICLAFTGAAFLFVPINYTIPSCKKRLASSSVSRSKYIRRNREPLSKSLSYLGILIVVAVSQF